MPELPSEPPKHPIGTFAFLVIYAVLFVAGWYGIYLFIFLSRQAVTP